MDLHYKVGYFDFIGDRSKMEDSYKIDTINKWDCCDNLENISPNSLFISIFDGHDGSKASSFARDNLFRYFINYIKDEEEMNEFSNDKDKIVHAFRETFKETDNDFLQLEQDIGSNRDNFSGTTALSLLISNNELYLSNCGDCRAIFIAGNNITQLSVDHRISTNTNEKERIIKSGGFIRDDRVNGVLETSRGIGDIDFKNFINVFYKKIHKPLIISEPEISHYRISELLQNNNIIDPSNNRIFLLVATDGLWDALSNEDCCDLIQNHVNNNENATLKSLCKKLVNKSKQTSKTLKRKQDNISLILIEIKLCEDNANYQTDNSSCDFCNQDISKDIDVSGPFSIRAIKKNLKNSNNNNNRRKNKGKNNKKKNNKKRKNQ
eukprot:TRINITY_DN5207_c0_g1_i2.p1 TRINITY_DN5207_c0_g1~~TRINITY_DN5207_c0_g1_i2.p1  ORF type:complete len:379 (-),score=97.44 TRINITY_DN5207_c0_g1_i2:42-1178(-)